MSTTWHKNSPRLTQTWTSFQAHPSWYYGRLIENAEDRLARVQSILGLMVMKLKREGNEM